MLNYGYAGSDRKEASCFGIVITDDKWVRYENFRRNRHSRRVIWHQWESTYLAGKH